MNKFKIFAIWMIVIEIVLVVLGNGLYIYERSGNSGRLYLVEVSRLVKEIEEQKLTSSQIESINLNKYETIVDIGEFVAGESCKHDYLVEEINGKLYRIEYVSEESNQMLFYMNPIQMLQHILHLLFLHCSLL